MKKLAVALAAIAASVVSTVALAGGYIGAGLGVGKIGFDCPVAVSCDAKDTAGKFTLGYRFGSGFAIEQGFTSFGKLTLGSPGMSGDVKVDGITLGAAYRAAVGDGGVTVRYGIARLRTTVSATGASSNSDLKTTPYIGVGVDAALNKIVKIEASADFSRAEYFGERANVGAVTLGLRFDF